MSIVDTGIDQVDITVAISCYNEERYIVDTIENVISALNKTGISYEIIVIDDVSSDGSVERVQEYIKQHSAYPITLRINQKNQGLANNFVDGAFLGKGKYYRLCCGDNAETVEMLLHIFNHVGTANIIIPIQKQAAVIGKTYFRKSTSHIYTFLVKLISGYNIKYYNGCAVYLRYHVMRWPPITLGFGFQADVTTRLLDEGVSYVQIPSLSIDRKGDRSTAANMRNVLSVIHTLLEIAFRRLRRFLYRKHIPKSIEIRLEDKG